MRAPFVASILALVPSLFVSVWSFSQVPGTRVYTQDDGFPGSVSYIISQDEQGFIWVGTNNGVARFDGAHFQVYDAAHGLKDKEILHAIPIGDSTVMFMPLLNNFAYYRRGRIYTESENPALKRVNNSHLNKVTYDPVSKTGWISDSRSSGRLFEVKDQQLTEHIISESGDWFEIDRVYDYHAFVRTNGKSNANCCEFWKIDLKNGSRTDLEFTQDVNLITRISWSTTARYLAVLTIDKTEVILFEQKNGQLRRVFTGRSQRAIQEVMIDDYNRLWTWYAIGGASCWGPIGQNMTTTPPFILFEDQIINHVFADRDQNIWFSTQSNGIALIPAPHWKSMELIINMGVRNFNVKSLGLNHEGHVTFSYQDRSNLTVLKNGQAALQYVEHPRDGFKHILPIPGGLALGSNIGLYFVHWLESDSVTYSVMSTDGIKDLTPETDQSLLVVSHSSCYPLSYTLQRSERAGSAEPLYKERAACALRTTNGMYFIGTPDGLFCKKGKDLPIERLNDRELGGANISALTDLNDNSILIGTNTKGLYSYSLESGKKKISDNEHLSRSYVKQILGLNDSTFWIATDHGLFRLVFDNSTKTHEIYHYNYAYGLPSNDVRAITIKNDTLFAATESGLGVFSIADLINFDPTEPAVGILEVSFGDTLIQFPKSVTVQHPNTHLLVKLNTLSLNTTKPARYRYQLKGLQDKWMETDGSEINLGPLKPGNYQFKVEASFEEIESSSNNAILHIEVVPRFWQTLWFKGLMAILLLAAATTLTLYLARRYKTRVYQKSLQKRRLAALELEAIKAQINPHFIANCLNSVQYFQTSKQYDKAADYLDLFAKLIQATLRYSQETFITLDEELEFLNNYLMLEKMRFGERLSFQIHCDPTIGKNELLPAMLIQPYVENALKHGLPVPPKKGKVVVSFEMKPSLNLEVTIMDNGPGISNLKREKSTSSQGLGLRLSGGRVKNYKELFDLNIDLSIENQTEVAMGTGTIVKLLIPKIPHESIEVQNMYH